jgi:hypothetical protein
MALEHRKGTENVHRKAQKRWQEQFLTPLLVPAPTSVSVLVLSSSTASSFPLEILRLAEADVKGLFSSAHPALSGLVPPCSTVEMHHDSLEVLKA